MKSIFPIVFVLLSAILVKGNPTGMIPDGMDPWDWWSDYRCIDKNLIVEVVEPDKPPTVVEFTPPYVCDSKVIRVSFSVGKTGNVEDVFEISRASIEEKIKIMESLKNAKFQPAIHNGEKVKIVAVFRVPLEIKNLEQDGARNGE